MIDVQVCFAQHISSTWMLHAGGAASVVYLQSLEDVVSSVASATASSPPNSGAAMQKHSVRCGGAVVKGFVEPSIMPSIQE
jgi:hypothetical protein